MLQVKEGVREYSLAGREADLPKPIKRSNGPTRNEKGKKAQSVYDVIRYNTDMENQGGNVTKRVVNMRYRKPW